MSSKIKIKPLVFFALFLLFAMLVLIKVNTTKKESKKAIIKNEAIYTKQNALPDSQDLYYLKHPYLIKGDQFNDGADYDSAIKYYVEASIKFKKEGQWENYVWINGYIARLYLYVTGKNFNDALPYLENALEKGKRYLDSNHPYMAINYYYIGLYYYKNKLPDKALELQNKSLDMLLKYYHNDNIYTADVHNAIGDIYENLLFDNIKAESNYLKSIRIKEALPGEEKKSVLTPGYYNLVKLSFSINDLEKAQSYCYLAIENAQYVKNYSFYWLELLDGALATIYNEQQFFGKAIEKLQNAILTNYKYNGDKSYIAFYYTSLGDIYYKSTRFDSAIIFYKKALQLKDSITLFSDQQKQAATANYSLGMTYLTLKDYKKAFFYLTKSLDICLKEYGTRHRETAKTFQGMGMIFRETGSTDSALKYYQAGLSACTQSFINTDIYGIPVAATINNSFTSFQLVRDKAAVLKELYDQHPADTGLLKTSLAYYCLADTLMTLFRSEYKRETVKLVFSKENNIVYEEAIDCAFLLYRLTGKNRYHDLVFDFMDRRKSSLLLEALNEKQVLQQAKIPAKDQDTLKLIQQELTFLQSQLQKENIRGNSEEPVLQSIHARIDVMETKLNSMYEKLSRKYPYYASIHQKPDTIVLRDLQEYSRINNSLVLEYFWGEKAVYILGVYKQFSHVVKVSRSIEMDQRLNELRTSLAKGYVFESREEDFAVFQRSSFYIYNALLKPPLLSFDKIINGEEKPDIVVIPDGPLYYLPLETLVTSDSTRKTDYRRLDYLVNNYSISYDYSTRLLLRKYKQQNRPSDPKLLALGFSNEQPDNNREEKKEFLHKDELPGSAKELKAISSYMKGKFYMGNDATENVFKMLAPEYDILHLAVHGEADSLNSYSSKLNFKKSNEGTDDGDLYAYEIYSLPIKAKLAVLSACESGIGKLYPGEGMYSIARGFLYAGCPSVLMSYWRVSDNATQLIISDFYKQIAAGDKINQSLRKAKSEYINHADARTAHPANWAAFVAIGDIAPLVEKNAMNWPVIIVMAILFTGTIFFLVKKKHRYIKPAVDITN